MTDTEENQDQQNNNVTKNDDVKVMIPSNYHINKALPHEDKDNLSKY